MGGGLGDVGQLLLGGGAAAVECRALFSGRGWIKKEGHLPVVAAVAHHFVARRLKRAGSNPPHPCLCCASPICRSHPRCAPVCRDDISDVSFFIGCLLVSIMLQLLAQYQRAAAQR